MPRQSASDLWFHPQHPDMVRHSKSNPRAGRASGAKKKKKPNTYLFFAALGLAGCILSVGEPNTNLTLFGTLAYLGVVTSSHRAIFTAQSSLKVLENSTVVRYCVELMETLQGGGSDPKAWSLLDDYCTELRGLQEFLAMLPLHYSKPVVSAGFLNHWTEAHDHVRQQASILSYAAPDRPIAFEAQAASASLAHLDHVTTNEVQKLAEWMREVSGAAAEVLSPSWKDWLGLAGSESWHADTQPEEWEKLENLRIDALDEASSRYANVRAFRDTLLEIQKMLDHVNVRLGSNEELALYMLPLVLGEADLNSRGATWGVGSLIP